jgi:hypothetical protein
MDNESFLFIDIYGIKRWKNKEGELHRLDGPAVEYPSGKEEWYQDGLLHRFGGPAVIHDDGTKEWYQNGKLHRLDGPALETLNGHKQWYVGGKRSREDGPAIIYSDGIKRWYFDGFWFKSKESYFDALSDEAKAKCLFSEDFLNG